MRLETLLPLRGRAVAERAGEGATSPDPALPPSGSLMRATFSPHRGKGRGAQPSRKPAFALRRCRYRLAPSASPITARDMPVVRVPSA